MNNIIFDPNFNELFKLFENSINSYEKNNRLWIEKGIQILHQTVFSLKACIEDAANKEITWSIPFAEMQYHVEADWDALNSIDLKIKYKIQDNKKEIAERLVDKFLKENDFYVFKALSNNMALFVEDNKETILLPADIIKELDNLSAKKKNTKLKTIERKLFGHKHKGEFTTTPFTTLFITGVVTNTKKKEQNFTSTLFIYFDPLIINKDIKQAYYPIKIGLNFKGYRPAKWEKEDKKIFWNILLKKIEETIPEKTIDFKAPPLPEPTVKLISKDIISTKVSLHTELQKFGKNPEYHQTTIFDILDSDTKQETIEYRIEVIGIDNTQAQNQALFAIQKLLTKTNYKGNSNLTYLNGDNSFNFNGYLPTLKFTPSQYLETYGVGKRETKRGKLEFNANERSEALKALRDLHDKRYLFYYEKKYWIKNSKGKLEKRFDIIKTIKPLISIIEGYKALTVSERNTVKDGETTQKIAGKLKVIAIEPAPILVDQIDTYFIQKPANCYEEIKLTAGKASKYVYLFIDFLLAEVAKREISSHREGNKNWIIERNYKILAHNLRMESYIKTRNWKAIRKALDNCYTVAKNLGYLLDYKTVEGKTREIEHLTLNPDKFKRVKEIEEERKYIEAKNPEQ